MKFNDERIIGIRKEELEKILGRKLMEEEAKELGNKCDDIHFAVVRYSATIIKKIVFLMETLKKDGIIAMDLSDLKTSRGGSFAINGLPASYKSAVADDLLIESASDFKSAERAYFCGNYAGSSYCGWVRGEPVAEEIKSEYMFGNIFKCRICGMTIGIHSETY